MKNTIFLIIGLMVALTACKPSEANYKRAYDTAIAAGRDADEDSTIYAGMRRQMSQREAVLDGDTVMIKTQWVSATADGGGTNDSIRQYCVVAAEFKQVFNARSMRDRLAGMGYNGAFVVQNSEPRYYVVALSTSQADEAAACLRKLRNEKALALKAPLPYILTTPQHRR